MLSELCKEEDATFEPTFPKIDSFDTEMAMNVCWNKSNNIFVGKMRNTDYSGKKRDSVLP